MEIAAGRFKSECLKLMDLVQRTHEELVITKRGKPVAKLVPVEEQPARPLFGFLEGTVIETGDVVAPLDDTWDADSADA